MDPSAFLRAKTLEMRQRHVKYEGTPYALEPNCKESPGGLRDLQVVIWVARAAGLGRTWAELAAKGLITPFEAKQLQARRRAEADPRPAAHGGRPARGPPGVRPADRRGRELRLQGHSAASASARC
jgi:UTP:GlnB (protein PII) uridylyltransferase